MNSSQRNFGKALDTITVKLGFKNTPCDTELCCKMPITGHIPQGLFLQVCGPPYLLSGWDSLKEAFEASRYKVKDCTKQPLGGITVTSPWIREC